AVEPGAPIPLSSLGDADLWMEIELKPTWAGRLWQFLSRPPIVRLAAWRQAGKELIIRHRAPPSMLAAGFLASPLLLGNDDVLNLYTNGVIERPASYSIELPADEQRY